MRTETHAALVGDFVDESAPLAEEAQHAIVDLESAWANGSDAPEALLLLQRHLHTIKGNAAMMGLDPIVSLAHAIEGLCGRVGREPAARNAEIAALLVEGGDLLSSLVAGARREPKGGPYLADLERRIRAHESAHALEPQAPLSAEPLQGAQTGSTSVRIDFQRLDEILDLLGEARVAHAAVDELAGRVGRHAHLEQAIGALGKTLALLQDRVLDARLLPVSTLFGRFRRYVRDLARQHGAPLRLATFGGDTPIDKSIIDRLGEPLLHLVRNAVAHGVEPAQVRRRAGKPAEATITLSAALASERVVVTVADDGRGLDLGAIAAKARRLGHDPELLSEEELSRLIFSPGFSTATKVSDLAGRGMGLDVVATTLHSMGGSISVESRPGLGTTFRLSLPLTLAVVHGLVVEVDRELLVVPMGYVVETLRLDDGALHEINQVGVMSWRDVLVPVCDGGVLLGTATGETPSRAICLVLASGDRRRALLVDRVRGHQDVVSKALDSTAGAPDAISGATILGDGRVVLILDAAQLVEQRSPRRLAPLSKEARHHV